MNGLFGEAGGPHFGNADDTILVGVANGLNKGGKVGARAGFTFGF